MVAVARHGPQELVAQTRAELLEAEITQVLGAASPSTALERLPPLRPVELNEGEDAGLEVVEAALRRSPPPQVPVLLSLATRHRLRPREGPSLPRPPSSPNGR